MTLQAVLGIAAGLLSFAAYPIYIRDILRGETKPSKVTWWILALLNAALAISYYAVGARDTLWIPISYTIGFTVIAFLSLKYGEGAWKKSDWICLIGAGISLLAWWVLQSAEIALYLIIITDFIGLAPTLYKTYKRPWTESKLSWTIAFAASALNVFAIERWVPSISIYPLYVLITNAGIVGFILFPRYTERPVEGATQYDMVPDFPTFKKLEFSDKEALELHAAKFQPYSDFEFASLWSWNVQDNMEISILRSNLVIRFADYVSGEFFYTYLGDTEVTETAQELIALSKEKGYGGTLHLVPEEGVSRLGNELFDIQESRDHYDYLYEIEQHVTYGGGKLKSRRNFLNGFLKTYPHYGAVPLDLADDLTRQEILELCRRWEENKGFPVPNEQRALHRFLDVAHHFSYSAVGITVDSTLVGFCTTVLLHDGRANALFEKVDTRYHGIHALLRHEVAKNLLQKGYTHLNYEQDLGILSLRQSKMAFNPTGFLKKYSISLK